jgi:uncharacterized membrane protein YkvI
MNEKAKSLGILLAFEVGALCFTTHVGGGFALGTQEVQYFVRFGKFGLYLPLMAMALLSTVFYLAWEFQRLYGISDYKEFFEKFFGRFGKIFMILYDIVFSCMVVLAAGAALAGMASALGGLLGIKISLYLGYLIAAVIVYIIASFGLKVVLASSAWMSLGIISVIVLLIIFRLPQITGNLANIPYKPLFGPTLFQSPFWFALVYAGFQSTLIGSYINGGSILKTHKDTVGAGIISFLLSGIMLTAMVLTISGNYPAVLKDPTPTITIVHQMPAMFTYLYSLMLLLALITTAVSVIYSSAKRWTRYGAGAKGRWGDEKVRLRIWVLAWLVITYVISNVGIVTIVKKGYGFFGYIAIVLIILPILILAPAKIAQKNRQLGENKGQQVAQ